MSTVTDSVKRKGLKMRSLHVNHELLSTVDIKWCNPFQWHLSWVERHALERKIYDFIRHQSHSVQAFCKERVKAAINFLTIFPWKMVWTQRQSSEVSSVETRKWVHHKSMEWNSISFDLKSPLSSHRSSSWCQNTALWFSAPAF